MCIHITSSIYKWNEIHVSMVRTDKVNQGHSQQCNSPKVPTKLSTPPERPTQEIDLPSMCQTIDSILEHWTISVRWECTTYHSPLGSCYHLGRHGSTAMNSPFAATETCLCTTHYQIPTMPGQKRARSNMLPSQSNEFHRLEKSVIPRVSKQ